MRSSILSKTTGKFRSLRDDEKAARMKSDHREWKFDAQRRAIGANAAASSFAAPRRTADFFKQCSGSGGWISAFQSFRLRMMRARHAASIEQGRGIASCAPLARKICPRRGAPFAEDFNGFASRAMLHIALQFPTALMLVQESV
jgi:hypothetical protein